MDITWLGHAAFQLKGLSQTVYIDPVRMEYCGTRTKPFFESPEPADIILLTHHHTDHCNPDSFARMRRPATIIFGPRSCSDKVRGLVQVIGPGEAVTIGGATIRAVHAYNVSRQRAPGMPFHPQDTGVGYIVTLDGHTVYHAGDTEPIPELEGQGPVDVALVPVDDHYTMSPEEALQCARMVQAARVIPMHFFDTPVERVLAAAGAVPDLKVQVLEVGETLSLE